MTGFDRNRLDELPSEYVDAITDFEQFKLDTGSPRGTANTYLNRVVDYFEWLVDTADTPALDEIDESHAKEFDNWAEATYDDSTYRSRIITLSDMFEIVDYLDAEDWRNPVAGLPDSQEVRDSHKFGRGIDVAGMSDFILSVRSPLWHAFFLTLLKTLCRTQQVANIRLEEIHINDPAVDQLYDDLDITHHQAVSHYPDTIFIPSNRSGNKSDSGTRIPIDSELKAALIRWLAVRPNTEESVTEPRHLFVSLGDNWGEQLAPSTVSMKFAAFAPEAWRPDENPFTPQDIRHWTTRQLRNEVPDHLIDYLRGDSPKIRDHYDDLLANYGERVRVPYLHNIPSLYF